MNAPRIHHFTARGAAESSIVASLVGIVILVMIAVGLSIMVDKRMDSSSRRAPTERVIERNSMELQTLRGIHERLLATSTAGANALVITESLAETTRQLQVNRDRIEELTGRKTTLEADIIAHVEALENHREVYRRRERTRAVGETLELLTLIDGRSFADVRIIGVSDAGLQIRHSDGAARIAASDLPRPWHHRFQWCEDERQALLARERQQADALTATPPHTDLQKPELPPAVTPGKPDDIQVKRRDLQVAREHAIRISGELDDAIVASRGRSASPPGSLETWQQRISRLQRELAAARARHHVAFNALAEVSPHDPTLRKLPDS